MNYKKIPGVDVRLIERRMLPLWEAKDVPQLYDVHLVSESELPPEKTERMTALDIYRMNENPNGYRVKALSKLVTREV